MTLRDKIAKEKLMGKDRVRHADPNGTAAFPVPEYGPHDIQPAANRDIWNPAPLVREEGGGE
jgi:NADH-quinone oxidoreductase subunit B